METKIINPDNPDCSGDSQYDREKVAAAGRSEIVDELRDFRLR